MQIELPKTLLDYFLWSNKGNINQIHICEYTCADIYSDRVLQAIQVSLLLTKSTVSSLSTTSRGRFSSGPCRARDEFQSTRIPTHFSLNHTQHLVAPGMCILAKKMPIYHVPLTRAFVSVANKDWRHTHVHNSPFSPNALAKRVWEIWIFVSNGSVKLNEFYANQSDRSG